LGRIRPSHLDGAKTGLTQSPLHEQWKWRGEEGEEEEREGPRAIWRGDDGCLAWEDNVRPVVATVEPGG